MSDEIFELTPGERNSAVWIKLMRYFTAQLAIARAKNDEADDKTTGKLRGQILAYKTLIALDTERPEIK